MIDISPLSSQAEAKLCARMMSESEPWLTLGRSYESALRILRDPGKEVYVAKRDCRVKGFTVLVTRGSFVGYIQSMCVAPSARGEGIGTQLLSHAENRILKESPNVFICVSSFNPDARRLYERLGFQVVGELKDYVIRGHSEVLLRKSVGPLSEFTPEDERNPSQNASREF